MPDPDIILHGAAGLTGRSIPEYPVNNHARLAAPQFDDAA